LNSITVENYLKAILALESAAPSGVASGGEIAAALAVTPGTVTSMLKRLSAQGLAKYEPYGGVRLTPKGRRMAVAVLHRHRIVETFLVKVLGFDWSEVHEEAERLEHAVSDKVLARLDSLLGFPNVDPHGDPIPRDGNAPSAAAERRLSECAPGEHVRISRVADQSEEFLRFAGEHGLKPGSRLRVIDNNPVAGTMQVSINGATASSAQPITLSRSTGQMLCIAPAEPSLPEGTQQRRRVRAPRQ
jgi:DtxR family Mn-dependent transcriptional regulator